MTAELEIDISTPSEGWPQGITELAEMAALAAWGTKGGADQGRMAELSLVFADDDMVQGLNLEWRGKDKPTNVLSFPADDFDIPEAPRMLGDVILALQTVRLEAIEQNKDFNHHLAHLIIHGVLHLLGHDHIEDEDAVVMEALEVELLAGLNIQNPYVIGGIKQDEFIKNG